MSRSRHASQQPTARIRWEPRSRRHHRSRLVRIMYLVCPVACLWLGALHVLRSSAHPTDGTHAQEGDAQPRPSPLPPPPPPDLTEAAIPPVVAPPIGYVLTSFQDGAVLGDGLRFLTSANALQWSALPGDPPPLLPLSAIPHATVFRDPSMVWHAPWFYLVFTSNLCVDQVFGHWQCRRHTKPRPTARFGFARSRNGSKLQLPSPRSRTPTHLAYPPRQATW